MQRLAQTANNKYNAGRVLMQFTLLQDVPVDEPKPDRFASARRLCIFAFRLCFFTLMTLSALLNIYTSLHLAPVVTKVNSLFERADVLFYTVYKLGCNMSNFIPPNQCAQL